MPVSVTSRSASNAKALCPEVLTLLTSIASTGQTCASDSASSWAAYVSRKRNKIDSLTSPWRGARLLRSVTGIRAAIESHSEVKMIWALPASDSSSSMVSACTRSTAMLEARMLLLHQCSTRASNVASACSP